MNNVQNFSFGLQVEESFDHRPTDIAVKLNGVKGPRSLQGIADLDGKISPINVCSTFIQRLQSQGTEVAVEPAAIIKAVVDKITNRESNVHFSLYSHI